MTATMQVSRSPAGMISCAEHVHDQGALQEHPHLSPTAALLRAKRVDTQRTHSLDNVESMCADMTTAFNKGSHDTTTSLEATVTCVSDDGSADSSDTGESAASTRSATPSAPAPNTAELADTVTQLQNLINEMHRPLPTSLHTTDVRSIPDQPATVHAPPYMALMGLDARLGETRLGHAGAAAIRRQRQVTKLQSDF